MQLGIRLTNGYAFENSLFGLPNERVLQMVGQYKPVCFRQDVGRLVRKILQDEPQEGSPKTSFAECLYTLTAKYLNQMGVETAGLKILSLLGTNADRYYETDCSLYLPESSGYECVVTIDAHFIPLHIISRLRDFWMGVSELANYSEDLFQTNLFRHNRIFDEYFRTHDEKERRYQEGSWILSDSYKKLWRSEHMPYVPPEMVDRPILKPDNHLLLTPYHLARETRSAFAYLVAIKFWNQIKDYKGETIISIT